MDDGPTATTAAMTLRAPNLAEGEEDEENDNKLGGSSPYCRQLIPKLRFARPMDFFDTQLTPTYMAWLVKATNSRAVADGAGVDIGLVESHFNMHVFNTCKTVW
jgi:hypothetical protein